MCRSGTAYPAGILVVIQTALSLVFTYSLFPRLTPAGILVVIQTALSLVFTYSDSLRVKRSNPVIVHLFVAANAFLWIATQCVCTARNDK